MQEQPKNNAVVNLIGVKAINTAIDKIIASSADMATLIIDTARSSLAHAQQHGDTSLFQRLLVEGLSGEPQWRGHLVRWARQNSPIELHNSPQGTVVKLDGAAAWNLDNLMKVDPRSTDTNAPKQLGAEDQFDAGDGLSKNMARGDRDFAVGLDRAAANIVKVLENTVYDEHGRATGAKDPTKAFYMGSTAAQTAKVLKDVRALAKTLAEPMKLEAVA